MVEIGGCPFPWHFMKSYSLYRLNQFTLCWENKQEYIRQNFLKFEFMNYNFMI